MNDDKKNPLSVEEDYFLPYVAPSSGSYERNQNDIDYVRENLWRALRIPKEFLGNEK